MKREVNGSTEYDVAVIGAGPAGLMAGFAAGSRGLRVAIIEKMNAPGRKLLITGKGRCNVTNDCDVREFISNIREGGRFMNSSLYAFDSRAVMSFFEERGVPLKVERGNRVFPQSDKAADIRDALVTAARKAGCAFVSGRAVKIETDKNGVCAVILEDKSLLCCRAAIVATGGLSYPKTGSTGDGYALARAIGHTVTPTRASLVSLICEGDDCARLEGLSLKNIRLTAYADEKKIYSEQGEMLFTTAGISGPLVLSLSGAMVTAGVTQARVEIDLKPALDTATLDKRILRDFSDNINRDFKNSLSELLPQKLIPIIIERSGISPEKKVNSITAAERASLISAIKELSFSIIGTGGYDEAVITAGGVELKEINPKTLESKLVKNLYFAGEVLNADAYTGGFNLGIAFATGHAAGSNVLGGSE